MTIDIKYSWFEKNLKPTKLNKLIKAYNFKSKDIYSILKNIHKYKVDISDEALLIIYRKYYFYKTQKDKLSYFIKLIESGVTDEKLNEFKKEWYTSPEDDLTKEVNFNFKFYKIYGLV